MVHSGDGIWAAQYLAPADQVLKYRYNRNDFGFSTDEQFVPDRDESRREVDVGTDPMIVSDEVSGWRWLQKHPPQADVATFTPDSLPRRDDPLLLAARPRII